MDYAIVSPLVDAIVERRARRAMLVAEGYPRETVLDCLARIARAEHKRRQAPPGIKLTGKAFGVGRRVPIAHGAVARRARPALTLELAADGTGGRVAR